MSPNATRCFNRPVSLLSCHPISIDRWLLSPSTPTGSVFFCSYMCVWQRKREKEKLRLPSPGSPAASHVWIEARFFEMLKSQPVCSLSVWHTQNLVTHSPIHSPFFPSFLFPLLLTLSISCKNVGLSCHYLQTEGEAKVCNSNKLVVKEKKGGKKIWTVKGPVANYSPQILFGNLISPFVSPLKTCFNKVRAPQQPARKNSQLFVQLQCQPCYFAKEDNISLSGLSERRLGSEAMG